jgi:hypothetical protein
MKIDKLHTLSQFIDLVTESKDDCFTNIKVIEHAEDNMETDMVVCAVAELIEKYNNFLKHEIARHLDSVTCELAYLDDDYPGCICIKNSGVIPIGFNMSALEEATKGALTLKKVEL